MLPALVVIVISEAARLRSFLYYGVGGALVGLASYFGSDVSERLENTTDVVPVGHSLQLAAAAGIIGGLAYWLIAGRNAGRWRDPRTRRLSAAAMPPFHFAVSSARRGAHEPYRIASSRSPLPLLPAWPLAFIPNSTCVLRDIFMSFEDANHNMFALANLSAADVGARYWSVDRRGVGGAGGGRARDQAGLAAAQIVDVGPRGRFPDRPRWRLGRACWSMFC